MSGEKTIFADALAISAPEERVAFLDRACGDNAALRAEVEALLAAHEAAAASFLESPPPGLASAGAPVDAAFNLAGVIIGHYKLLERIGEGGMGVVYMAEQLRPVKRRVALKIIKPGLDTRQVIGRFEAERQALAMMDHPSIAKVFEAGATPEGRPYFVMELVRGVPITEYCDQHHLTARQRLELFVKVCQAVQHAHQKGIIHRDLKPKNVLVTLGDADKPIPKVIDFGIAKATATGEQPLTDRTLFTEFRQLIGTPLYMSPEQAEMSQLTDVDTRSDVYSLGVLLYELLTGTTPFDKQRLAKAAYDEVRRILREEEPPRPSTRLSTLGETIHSISAQRQTDPKRLSQTVRGELDWIVMKALEKDRVRRYETANGLARDVERYLADQPVEACPPSRMYRLRKFARRNKAAMTIIALITVVLIVATLVSAWQAALARRAERLSDAERDQAQKERRRADEQAAIADAVNKFLCGDVIGQSNPEFQNDGKGIPNPDLTVREALDRASASIAQRFRDKPWARDAIHDTIGKAYAALGIYDKAEEHLRASLDVDHVDSHDVGRSRDAIGSLHALGDLYLREWNAAKAEPLLIKAAQEARLRLGENDDQTLSILCSLSDLYHVMGDYPKAEAICREVLEAHRRKDGENDPNTLVMWSNLGEIYEQAGEFSKAEAPLMTALSGQRRVLGGQAVNTLMTLASLARVYRDTHQFDKSEQCYREALNGFRQIYGDGYPHTREMLSRMARLYELQDRYADAEPLLREAAEWYVAHPASAGALVPDGTPQPAIRRLVICYRRLHQIDKADEWQRHLQPLVKIDLEKDFPTTLPVDPKLATGVLNHRAGKYAQLGNFSRAVADWKKSIELHPSQIPLASLACTELYLGEESAYQTLRPRFLHAGSNSTSSRLFMAEAGLLRPLPTDQLDHAARWLNDAVAPATRAATGPAAATQPARGSDLQIQLVRGMLDYRRACYSSGAERLAGCCEEISSKDATPFDRYGRQAELRATAMAYLAICQYQLRHISEAQRSLKEAQETLVSEVPAANSGDPNVGSTDWLIAHIAAKEAAATLELTSPAPAPAPVPGPPSH